jgi:hypothetical protein
VKPAKSAAGGPAPARSTPGQVHVMRGMVVVLVACMGWYLGVRPLEKKLDAKKAELKSTNSQLGEFERGVASEAPIGLAIDSLAAQGRQINAWTALSGDEGKLYEAFRSLAAKHSVRIERVEPSSATRSRGANKAGTPELSGYTVEVTGTYKAVAQFMDACEQDLGVTKVTTFHMSPGNVVAGAMAADPPITAIIETSHLKLAVPGVAPASTPMAQAPGAESGS